MVGYFHALVLLLLATGAVFLSWRWFGHILTPFSVFFGVWFAALAMFCVRWVRYTPIGATTEAFIAFSMTFFGLGWFLAYGLKGGRACLRRKPFDPARVSTVKLRHLIFLSCGLGLIGLGDFLLNVQRALGLGTYLRAPYLIRQAMGAGQIVEGIKVFNWLNVLNVVLCVIYLQSKPPRGRTAVWTVLVVSVASTLFMEDRTRFFYAILWAGFVLAYLGVWRAKKIIVGATLVGALLLVQFLVVASWLGKVAQNSPVLMDSKTVSGGADALLGPYVYFTGSFPALQDYTMDTWGRTNGEMTFYPAFRLLSLFDKKLAPPSPIGEFYDIPIPFNTYTWLQQFFDDFGTAGIVLGPLFVGLVAGLVYFGGVRRGSLFAIYANGLICFCLAISVMVNQLTQSPAWYFVFVGWLVCAHISRRPAPRRAVAQGVGSAQPAWATTRNLRFHGNRMPDCQLIRGAR